MNSRKKFSLSQKGFTLVELLIVIVIIGILAGVVIGVLNPIQQQNRARDAGVRAQIDKMALSTKSLYSSSPRTIERSPSQAEFAGGLANIVAGHNCTSEATDAAAATHLCTFTLSGVTLPPTCDAATTYSGDDTDASDCQFAYSRTPDSFGIATKGFAEPQRVFLYYYEENPTTGAVTEGFWACDQDWAFEADFTADTSACTSTL